MEQCLRVELGGDAQILGDELVVPLTADAGMPVAEVIRIVEQEFVVGAAVEVDCNGPLRMDASGSGVDSELAHADVGAVDPPVADPQDLLGIRDDQQVDVLRSHIKGREGGLDVLDPVDRQVDGAGTPVVARPHLDGLPDGGVVDDGQHLRQVVGEETVVEHLVAAVQLVEVDVPVQVGGEALQLPVAASDLLVEGLDS